ncbi:uncharacterized protein LOC142640260 [Castanea sativa]|uniref:uncharacterized protein LOC142640260 n=1 Tax=Castanea sativa TaxID=21020 RepID=UPI003F652DD4
MRWYIDKRVDDGIMRHPAESDEWKEFDLQHPDFDLEPRNVSPHQSGNEIDIYLKPLVDELKELWEEGVETYDAYSKEHFQMRATLLWTIHDYLGFDNVFGWRIKGDHSCYTCNDEPYLEVLESKIGFIKHRAYLPMEYRWRQSRLHNGLSEKRKKSLELAVGKIQKQLDRIQNIILGKYPSIKKRQLIGEPNWSNVSILYKLPYWKNKKLKHNIDVMHVEKNISESTYDTLLGIEGKNKGIDKARIDLQNMNFRHMLHLTQRPDGSYDKPWAFFSLSPNERDGFYGLLKSVKYPDGYVANISRTLKQSELEKLEELIILIICKLERFFPPIFFDVMVHFAVHLPREAILGGPVQYRYLEKLKRYVSNRARPEGSIAEACILKECINNWSLYINGIETIARPTGDRRNDGNLSRALLDTAHWYLLYNNPELEPYLKGVFDVLEVRSGESNNNTEDSDTFQQKAIVDAVSVNVEDNIIEYCMGDVETEVVLEGGTSGNANQNEEHDIPDVDLDMDYDM